MAEAEAEAAKKIASTLCCMCCWLCCCAAIVAAAAAKTASNSSPSRAEQQLCCARARSRSLGCFGCGALSCSRCLRFYILLLFLLLLLLLFLLLLLLLLLLSIRLRPHLPACLGCPASGTVQARSLLVALSLSRFLSHSLHSLAHSHAAALLLSQSASLPTSLLLSFAQRIGL